MIHKSHGLGLGVSNLRYCAFILEVGGQVVLKFRVFA